MSKRTTTSAGVIQRENFTSAPGSATTMPASSSSSRTAATRCAASPSPSLGVDRAAGEDPHAAHEARVRRALDEQDLERVGPAAQQDDRRRLARHGLLAGDVELLAGRGTVDLHGMKGTFRPMSETTTAQKWICDSCGFIYDPADGDPDGGIPPGTAFDDIPDTWFCPVCGARKRDFTPYED